jgi:HEAT repeat protein
MADATLEIRGRAAEALGLIGKEPAKAVPALTKMLQKDEEKGARYAAAEALGRFGAAAKEAVPVCIKKLESNPLDLKNPGEDNQVRAQVARTLGLIGPEAKTAVKALLKPFQADPMKGELEDLDVLKDAAEALGRLGAASPDVVPGLIKALESPLGIGYYEAVCKALGAIGPAAKAASKTLKGLAANDQLDEATRAAAAEALKKVGG